MGSVKAQGQEPHAGLQASLYREGWLCHTVPQTTGCRLPRPPSPDPSPGCILAQSVLPCDTQVGLPWVGVDSLLGTGKSLWDRGFSQEVWVGTEARWKSLSPEQAGYQGTLYPLPEPQR